MDLLFTNPNPNYVNQTGVGFGNGFEKANFQSESVTTTYTRFRKEAPFLIRMCVVRTDSDRQCVRTRLILPQVISGERFCPWWKNCF
jgi:hypothetical protein